MMGRDGGILYHFGPFKPDGNVKTRGSRVRIFANRCNLRWAALVAACLLAASGCGAKGPLYLPEDGQAQEAR